MIPTRTFTDNELSTNTNRTLHVFAAAGHHNYVKAAHVYVQMMKTYEKGSAEEIAIYAVLRRIETMSLGIQAMRGLVFGVI